VKYGDKHIFILGFEQKGGYMSKTVKLEVNDNPSDSDDGSMSDSDRTSNSDESDESDQAPEMDPLKIIMQALGN